MASINGLTVKGLSKFKGHEGEPLYQGNLYLGNKKLGFWSQDSWGCIVDIFNPEPEVSEKLLNETIHSLYKEKDVHGVSKNGSEYSIDYDLTQFMFDYISLVEDEKMFKNVIKKGYAGMVIATDGYHQVAWSLPKSYIAKSDDELLKELKDDIAAAKRSFLKEDEFTKHSIKIYRSLDDFIIGESIKLEDIMRKPDLNKSISDATSKVNKNNAVSFAEKELEQ